MSRWATVYGLVIALIGFVLTRFTVTLAATDTTVRFLFAGIVPLVLGLLLTAFGVILAVGAYDTEFVRTTALWCVLGTGTMLVLVVLTILGSRPEALMDVDAAREQTSLSNFLIGGAIGGTLTGLYAAQNRRHRTELRQQANRLVLLNRLLRDRVINAATAIKGYTNVAEQSEDSRPLSVIEGQADAVIETVEDVKYLSETAERTDRTVGSIDLWGLLAAEVEAVGDRHPDAAFELPEGEETLEVLASAQLREVFAELLENAVEYSDATPPRVEVGIESSHQVATVSITDNGPGLPESQRALLERGEIAEFDDPTTGFGLNIVRLLVESFDGEIRTSVTGEGSTIEVELPRAAPSRDSAGSSVLTAPGVSPSRIGLAISAGLAAGVAMGGAMLALGGDVPVIGSLYGLEEFGIASIAHEFHSVVFGLVYAALLSTLPGEYTDTAGRQVVVATGFAVFLWLVAAGLVMPFWLQLVGVDAAFPNLAVPGFVGHVVWGITLGALYHAGDQWLTHTGRPDAGVVTALRSWV
jgi:two-component system OmpR family sensor kinase